MNLDPVTSIALVTLLVVSLLYVVYTQTKKKRRFDTALINFCEENGYILSRNPEEYVIYRIEGEVNGSKWKLDNFFKRPSGMMSGSPENFLKFSAGNLDTGCTVLIGKFGDAEIPKIDFGNNFIQMLLAKILGEETAGELKDIHEIEFGDTQVFRDNFLILATYDSDIGSVLDDSVQERMITDFEWCDDNDFAVMILNDRLVIRVKEAFQFEEIESVIGLGSEMLKSITNE